MSCQYSISIAPYQNAVNSTILPEIGETELPSNSDTTGTYNNMKFTNGGITFSGSVGNTTTDGYYVTYNGSITTLQDVMNFTIDFPSSTYCLEPGRSQNFPFTTTKTYNYTYFNDIQCELSINSNNCVYTPQVTGEVCYEVCCCGNPISSCCYDTCDCSDEVIVPSTYDCCKVCVPVPYSGLVTTKPEPDTITLSYVTGNTLPSGYKIVESFVVNLPAGFFSPLSTLYFYNFDVTEMNVNIQSVTLSLTPTIDIGLTLDVSTFNSDFNTLVTKYLVPYLNTLINGQAIEFQFVYNN
jgi:hypothetical protein